MSIPISKFISPPNPALSMFNRFLKILEKNVKYLPISLSRHYSFLLIIALRSKGETQMKPVQALLVFASPRAALLILFIQTIDFITL